jgi:hypothetical protein
MPQQRYLLFFSDSLELYIYVGEVYVAFFNLCEQKAVISAKTSDLAKVLLGRDLSSCKGSEVWSGSDIVITQGTLSAEVEMHGTALFVLNCN